MSQAEGTLTSTILGGQTGQSGQSGTAKRFRGAGIRAVLNEMRVVFTRRRNLLLLLGIALVPLIVGIAVKVYGGGQGNGSGLIDRITGSGMFLVAVSCVVSLPLFLPLIISVVAGDSLAGDAQIGVTRYALLVPVSRTKLLVMKACAVFAFIIASVAVIFAVGLLAGSALFGVQKLSLISGDTIGIGSGIARMAGISAYVILSLTGLGAVGLFISSLTEVPLAAMAATAIVAIASQVLDAIPQLHAIQPGLLTHHWMDLTEFLRINPDFGLLGRGLLVQLAWVVIFGSLGWARMVSANITA